MAFPRTSRSFFNSIFKKFGDKLKSNNIQILFQNTIDKRVEKFLSQSAYNLKIIEFNYWLKLSSDFEIVCFKDGFYDSGLAIKTSDKTIINMNDCEIKDKKRCEEVLKITGECDILASQFSYAAWKGGVENVAWRKLAAKEKIETMQLQATYFKPKVIIPFASYIYFSNKANYYLNDCSNKPSDVVNAFNNHHTKVNVMKPFEVFSDIDKEIDNSDSLNFWNNASTTIGQKLLNEYEVIPLSQLKKSFNNYTKRVFKNNARWFMWLARYFSPVSAFKPLVIRLNDLDMNVNLDIFAGSLLECTKGADISMNSESLNFVLSNNFGFDTLTVNGCFEEVSSSGFSRAARTLAIENLNNMGIEFRPGILFNYQLMAMFISKLSVVSKKLKLAKAT